MYVVYILYNQTIDKYYVGYTSNLSARIVEHNKSIHISKYTRKQKGSWKLEYSERYESKSEAVKREKEIKGKKSRKYSQSLIH